MARRDDRPDPGSDQVVVGVEISARRRTIEVTAMRRGRGKHTHYATLSQAPPELRGEALQLVRSALLGEGYASLAELDEALTSDLVVPEPEDESPET